MIHFLLRRASWLLVLLPFAYASQLYAEKEVRPAGQIHSASSLLVGARLNPLGLRAYFHSGAQTTLYDSQSAALRENFVFLGGRAVVSPAFARLGAMAVFQPLTLLTFTGIYEGGYFFGSFDDLQSYDSPTADYSDSARNAQSKSDDPAIKNYAAWGHHLRLKARLRAKVWQIAFQNEGSFHMRHYPLREGDSYSYDSDYDTLAKNGGWLYVNEADLVWQPNKHLSLGVRHFWARPLFKDTGGVNNAQQRMGPLFKYSFDLKEPASQLSVIAMVHWYLQHRFRTGQDVSQAIPWAVVGAQWDF